jgi:hypothetical protein
VKDIVNRFLQRHPDVLPSVLALLLPMSLILNVYFGSELHSLWRPLFSPAGVAAARPPSRAALGIGAKVPPITGKHVDGSPARVDYAASSTPTLLYVLSPKCIWCKRNQPNFQTLLKEATGRFRVVCVSLQSEGLDDYVADNELTAPGLEVLSDVPQPLQQIYSFSGTPQTLVVSPEGRVMARWSGALDGPSKAEAEKFFRVKLPGIASD